MIINLEPVKGLGLMEIMAASNGSEIKDNLLTLPDYFGTGYIRRIGLGPMMSMMIHQYELTQDLTLAVPLNSAQRDFITFSFRNAFAGRTASSTNLLHDLTNSDLWPSVQVSSGHTSLEMTYRAKDRINTIIVNIHREALKDLINRQNHNTVLDTLVSGKQAFLYEEIISPEIRQVASNIINENPTRALEDFFYKLKAQELIYFFLEEFVKRGKIAAYSLNGSDLKKIYLIKNVIVRDLASVPNLKELTALVAFSESKMTRAFKQIFGTTIYAYHQKLRICKAAFLIKNEHLSVSEAGYQLGFTNMSHFSRIFEKHIGMKPKKYSLTSN